MAISRKKLQGLIVFIVIALLLAGVYMFIHRHDESTDDAAIDGHTVTISAKVPGYVVALNIDDNQAVHAGDILLQIDPADYVLKRDRAQAMLDAAKAQVISAEATSKKSRNDFKRTQRLSAPARSQEELDQTTSAAQGAQAALDAAQAQVKQAEVELAQAEKDLNDTNIIAPQDGIITKRGVERGDYVQPGQQLTSLVGTQLWVIANYKETQIRHMQRGDLVDIRVDAFPDAKLQGKVDSIQSGTGAYFSAFPPENATGNYVKIIQRVPVKILFDAPPNLHLGPGMSVTPVVHTGSAADGH